MLQNFVYGDTPSLEAIEGLVSELFGGGGEGGDERADAPQLELALTTVSNRHDLRILVLRTLLTQLELHGYLEAGTPFYASYRFKPLVSSREILDRFEGSRRALLADLFRQAKKGRTWLSVDLDAAARNLGQPRDRLMKALDYLGEKGWLEVEASGVRHRYTVLRRPEDEADLAMTLAEQAADYEQREIERLEQVLELVTHDGCLSAHLCAHFGEQLEGPCGHCSWCDSGEAAILPQVSGRAAVDEELWQRAEEVRRAHADPLGDPRSFARFLTGLTSPRLGRKRLSSHELFGSLAGVPFEEILFRAESGGDASA
ncbi:MAG: RecQ family zinc-binding domain-containing protein [Acidobacteriota bacterium]